MVARKKRRQKDWSETCTFFGTFIEWRHRGVPDKVPKGDEGAFYDAYYFCLSIDCDGMRAALGLPEGQKRRIFRTLRKLGLSKLVENTKEAAAAFRKSGLRLGVGPDWQAVSALMRPFEKVYYRQLRLPAYARMHRLLSSKAFLPYALNCHRLDKEGGNPLDPKEWTAKKLKSLEILQV